MKANLYILFYEIRRNLPLYLIEDVPKLTKNVILFIGCFAVVSAFEMVDGTLFLFCSC